MATTNGEGYVKYHRQALKFSSTLRKVSRADRATFMDYVALARWRAPYVGCLCDLDGTPWSRTRRAKEVGESYTATKRTEEKLMAVGLITFQTKGVDHTSSVGRLHIVSFADYQSTGNPPKSEAHSSEYPPKSEVKPSEIGEETLRNRRLNPPKSEPPVSAEKPSGIGGLQSESPIAATGAENSISAEKPSESEGWPPEEVKKVEEGYVQAPQQTGFGNGDLPDDLAMRKQNNPLLWGMVMKLDWAMRTREKFFVGVLGAVNGPDAVPADERHAVSLLEQYGPEGNEQYFGRWLERVKKLAGPQSDSSRSDALDEQERQIHEEWLKSQSEERAT